MIATLFFIVICAQPTDSLQSAKQAMEAQSYQAAIELYQSALKAEPDLYDAQVGLARAFSASGQYDESESIYSQLLDKNSDNHDVRLLRGILYGWMKRYGDAQSDLVQVVDAVPEYADAWSALGNVYLWSKQYEAAVEAYSKWAALNPDAYEPLSARAKAYAAMGDEDLAKADALSAKERGASENDVQAILDRIDEKRQWQAALRYAFDSLSGPRSDWHQYSLEVQRKFDQGSITLQGTRYHRYHQEDEALKFDGYLDLWEGAYGNLSFQIASDVDFLPQTDIRIEVFQSLYETWEVSANYRRMNFATDDVDIFGVGFGKYIGPFYVRVAESFTTSGNHVLNTTALTARYYLNDDSFLEASGGIGEEVIAIAAGPVLQTVDTAFFEIRAQHYFSDQLGAYVGYTYYDLDQIWTKHGVVFGLMLRW
ncbi:MAG: YaiO family outer membrane beta-barrel protein [Candidatus Hinthialibacter antarcticus]|nr:YaiO family outer membrane beta-barrel protein [Candidatus Hinthialibacter antarcticus]